MDVTFFVVGDTHFGWETPEVNNGVQIEAMNGIPGMSYPGGIGGTVGVPSGVLVAGDLTDSGTVSQWQGFQQYYGLIGGDGLLDVPCFEGSGNHDSDTVRDGISVRHGSLTYSWDWDPIHAVGMDVYPTLEYSEWLGHELATVGPDRPVVLFHHYGFDSFSLDWWPPVEREVYRQAIAGYNVIGILHGHTHGSWHYTWQGHDIYTPGSVKGSRKSFLAVHVTDTSMSVAEYRWTKDGNGQWNGGSWGWTDEKSITVPGDPFSHCGGSGGSGGPNRRYAAASASAGGDGLSWGSAYKDLQDALDDASNSGNGVGEIWVAAGTYKPDRETGDRSVAFRLANGVAVYGGFPVDGGDGTFGVRAPAANVTMLSGDLNGDDGPDFANNGENSYHVVIGCGVDGTSVLDGFTISGGNANGGSLGDRGGGMLNQSGSPVVRNCTFSGNAAVFGGGMCNYAGDPTVTSCGFVGNSATGDAISDGGGMLNFESDPAVTGCTFSGNSAADRGGGMYNLSSSPTVTGCTLTGNTAGNNGGGICNDQSAGTMADCTFSGNTAVNTGGGVCNEAGSNVTVSGCTFVGNVGTAGGAIGNDYSACVAVNSKFLSNSAGSEGGGMYDWESQVTATNCSFSGNSAAAGGGMYNFNLLVSGDVVVTNCTFSGNSAPGTGWQEGGGGVNVGRGASTLTNCVFWGNSDNGGMDESAQVFRGVFGLVSINYSCVQGWTGVFGGNGNIGGDPLLADADGPDAIAGTGDDDLRLQSGSPCIDAGDNAVVTETADLAGLLRRADDLLTADTGSGTPPVVDMGAFEFAFAADSDGDGDVDTNDFLVFSACFNGALNPPTGSCENQNMDIDGDGDVDVADFLTFSSCFNGSLNPPGCQ